MFDRLRDSVVFYLKVDFGLIAGAGALFTLFRLEDKEIVKILYNLSDIIHFLIGLICFGLVIERIIALRPNDFKDEKAYCLIVKATLVLQLVAHLWLFGYLSGYTIQWLELGANHK